LKLWEKHRVRFGFGLDSAADELHALKIASAWMPRETALAALTAGGMACTDLATDEDQVQWLDLEAGVANRVTVAGKVLFEQGILHNQPAVELAQSRIAEAMEKDEHNRKKRKLAIDSALPKYLEAVNRCCG
jgi:hypothetical protein